MVFFHSYVKLPEGQKKINPIKPAFSYGFPMVFLCFSHVIQSTQRFTDKKLGFLDPPGRLTRPKKRGSMMRLLGTGDVGEMFHVSIPSGYLT